MEAENVWLVLAAIFFAIGIVGTLGEYVFHWWKEPFDWAGPLSLLLGLASLGWSASARGLRRMHRELLAGQQQLLAAQAEHAAMLRELLAMQREHTAMLGEQTALLREVVASFRAR